MQITKFRGVKIASKFALSTFLNPTRSAFASVDLGVARIVNPPRSTGAKVLLVGLRKVLNANFDAILTPLNFVICMVFGLSHMW